SVYRHGSLGSNSCACGNSLSAAAAVAAIPFHSRPMGRAFPELFSRSLSAHTPVCAQPSVAEDERAQQIFDLHATERLGGNATVADFSAAAAIRRSGLS